MPRLIWVFEIDVVNLELNILKIIKLSAYGQEIKLSIVFIWCLDYDTQSRTGVQVYSSVLTLHYLGEVCFYKVTSVYCFFQPHLNRSMTKPTKSPEHPANTQISLGIRLVWSVFAVRIKKHWVLSFPLHAQRRLADQTGRISRLIWAFAGRTCHFVYFVMMQVICIAVIILTLIKEKKKKNILSCRANKFTEQSIPNPQECTDFLIIIIIIGNVFFSLSLSLSLSLSSAAVK